MKFIIGKKIGMTQFFKEDGGVLPITLVDAGPVEVTKIKTKEKDGYDAIQVGYEEKKIKGRVSKFRYLKEFRGKAEDLKIGDKIDVSIFQEGEKVKISGISKGKGFQGVVKRHKFKGMPASHGHKHKKRSPGSIGQRFPQHTLKGTRMAGHMGAKRVTVKNLEIVKIDKKNSLLAIKGALPGRRGTLLEIVGQ